MKAESLIHPSSFRLHPFGAPKSNLSHKTERQPIQGALLADINLNSVRDHIDTAIKRRGYDGPTEPEAYLIEHGCLVHEDDGKLTPTLAGIVAFGCEPHRYVNVCGIGIAEFSGLRPNTTDLVLSRQICGDLMTIIDRAVDLLWARTEHRTHIVGTERVEEQSYPIVDPLSSTHDRPVIRASD